jgi:hypothetical protein
MEINMISLTLSFPLEKCDPLTTKCSPRIEVSKSPLCSLNGLCARTWDGLAFKKIIRLNHEQ